MSTPVKVGIVGLGRWAKVLTRAASKSDKLQIVAGYSRSADTRAAFQKETGVPTAPDMKTLLANPEIRGVILTVPNEQHLPLAEVRQDRRQIARPLEHGSSRGAHWHAELVADHVRQRRLPEARRPIEQHVIQRLAPSARGGNRHLEVRAYTVLPDVVVQRARAQARLVLDVVRRARGSDQAI